MDRYGQRTPAKIYNRINDLRKAIRAEGTPAIQDAWDHVEQFVDVLFQREKEVK